MGASLTNLTLGAEEYCDVYWQQPRAPARRQLAWLSNQELLRAAKISHAAGRMRFVTGAVLLRYILAAELGREPKDVTVDRSCPDCGAQHGRPVVRGSDVQVSVSHSEDVVGVAIHPHAWIGLDVERVRPVADAWLGTATLAHSERPFVTSSRDLLRVWARKESAVKCTGHGLRMSLPSIVVSPPRKSAELYDYAGMPYAMEMHDIPTHRGYVASVTLMGTAETSVRVHF